jgi:hypothetical protein
VGVFGVAFDGRSCRVAFGPHPRPPPEYRGRDSSSIGRALHPAGVYMPALRA